MKTAHEMILESELSGGSNDFLDRLIDIMERHSEQFKPKWIPVSENPPEIGKVYFLLQRNKNSFEGFRLEHHTGRMLFGQMLGNRFVETQDVTHYCERPELPKLPETPKPE